MFTPHQALENLRPEQRSELAADADMAAAFAAAYANFIASLKPSGVWFGGMSAPAEFDAHRAFETVRRERDLARTRAAAAKSDRDLIVVLEGPEGFVTMTDLNTLCDSRGIGWSERCDIRRAVQAGETYRGDNAGWTRLTREFTVRDRVAARRIFAGEAA